jgi:hypothetical protein
VESLATDFDEVKTPTGDTISVGNLFACTGIAEKGDSGGIVFAGTKAAGIVVARSKNGWVLLHRLEDAVRHLSSIIGRPVDCFA